MWIAQSKRWGGGNQLGNRVGNAAAPERKRFANAGLHGGLSELLADDSAAPSPTAKSPRNFDGGGPVGLGIVAAMNCCSAAALGSLAALSDPIPIGSARATAVPRETEEEELSESYTCVTWYVGGSLAGKRVYFEEGSVVF